jgi:ketosteroid isomerase-like protein
MQSQNVATVRTAYEAYARGDLPTMLGYIDPDLEWTYLDPSFENPEPQVCHGRKELQTALERQVERGLTSELEEVIGNGDRVVVVVRTPGVDAHRVRKADDRNFDVLTVFEGHIVAIHACRDREEALSVAGLG